MEVRANFPLSVSGFALDTSPLKGWRKGMNSPRSAPFLTPFRGEVSSPKGETERGTSNSRCSPYAIALSLVGRDWGGGI